MNDPGLSNRDIPKLVTTLPGEFESSKTGSGSIDDTWWSWSEQVVTKFSWEIQLTKDPNYEGETFNNLVLGAKCFVWIC